MLEHRLLSINSQKIIELEIPKIWGMFFISRQVTLLKHTFDENLANITVMPLHLYA